MELKRLERENERLRMENDFLKKVRGDREEVTLSQICIQDKYEAIQSSVEQFGYLITAYATSLVSRMLPTTSGYVRLVYRRHAILRI